MKKYTGVIKMHYRFFAICFWILDFAIAVMGIIDGFTILSFGLLVGFMLAGFMAWAESTDPIIDDINNRLANLRLRLSDFERELYHGKLKMLEGKITADEWAEISSRNNKRITSTQTQILAVQEELNAYLETR